MNKRIILILVWLPVLSLNWSVSCYCQSSTSFQLRKGSISNGGGVLNSSGLLLKESTIGSMAIGTSESNSFILNGRMFFTAIADSNRTSSYIPNAFLLHQNFPNPFNPTTLIHYQLAKNCDVNVSIYNLQGKLVRTLINGEQAAGNYQVRWNGTDFNNTDVASGVYLVKFTTPYFTDVRKMVKIQ